MQRFKCFSIKHWFLACTLSAFSVSAFTGLLTVSSSASANSFTNTGIVDTHLESTAAQASPTDNKYEVPKRIVSAGGSITEIIYALGAQGALVATDTSSSFPHSVSDLPKVGYYRQLSAEGILSFSPDTLLMLEGGGPDGVIQQLSRLGVEVIELEQPRSIDGLYTLIRTIGNQLERQPQAQALIDKIDSEISALSASPTNSQNTVKSLQTSIQPAFLMSVNERGIMAAGTQTTPNLIMQLLNIENPFDQFKGFKPISSEMLIGSNIDVLFLPSHQAQGRTQSQLCAMPALKQWAAKKGCNIQIVDSLKFLGLTPRIASAASSMREALKTPHLILGQSE